MAQLHHAAPWLRFELGTRQPVLSFAPHRPGLVTATRIIWRQVRDTDLRPDLDAGAWLTRQLDRAGITDCVAMMTSCDIAQAIQTRQGRVHCVATVGLGNAERIGQHQPAHTRQAPAPGYGTINIAVQIAGGLTEAARIEALSLTAAARTTAILEARLDLPGGPATGTGTDCIAIAAAPGDTAYAGMHTTLGRDLGRAVYDAVTTGAKHWLTARRTTPHRSSPQPPEPVSPR